jgi:hypothetical protein
MSDTNKRENLDFYIVFVLSAIAVVFAFWYNYTHPHMVVKYDCSISEISPDYPIEVKEGCRKLRAKNNLQNLNKNVQ